jgi:hypothetical protein
MDGARYDVNISGLRLILSHREPTKVGTVKK